MPRSTTGLIILHFLLGLALIGLTLFFAMLDLRKCDREHYYERFGSKASSLWIFPTLIFGMLTYLWLRLTYDWLCGK